MNNLIRFIIFISISLSMSYSSEYEELNDHNTYLSQEDIDSEPDFTPTNSKSLDTELIKIAISTMDFDTLYGFDTKDFYTFSLEDRTIVIYMGYKSTGHGVCIDTHDPMIFEFHNNKLLHKTRLPSSEQCRFHISMYESFSLGTNNTDIIFIKTPKIELSYSKGGSLSYKINHVEINAKVVNKVNKHIVDILKGDNLCNPCMWDRTYLELVYDIPNIYELVKDYPNGISLKELNLLQSEANKLSIRI